MIKKKLDPISWHADSSAADVREHNIRQVKLALTARMILPLWFVALAVASIVAHLVDWIA